MLKIIKNNLEEAPKTLNYLIWGKITSGIDLTEREYKYWLKIRSRGP